MLLKLQKRVFIATLSCLVLGGAWVKGGRIKHQGEIMIFRSFSYNNQVNLRVFFQKFTIWPPTTLQLGKKEEDTLNS